MNEIKVLLVDDNPVDLFMVRLALERSDSAKFKVDSADRLGAAMARANSAPPDVILLDLGLPDAQGLETLVLARAALPNIPILVLSGLDDEEVAIQAVQQGAQDYLLKGAAIKDVLPRAIRYAIARHRVQEHVVRDFLQFARPSEPRLVILPADQPLRQVLELLAAPLARNDIHLSVEDSPPAQVKIDPEQIEQVLIKLVQNAADAIGQGGRITLRARLDSRLLAGQIIEVVVLEVSDTSPGIPPELEKHLFIPFSSMKSGGIGLGLSIAARIVEKHGGTLQYQKELNRETIFSVVLPRLKT